MFSGKYNELRSQRRPFFSNYYFTKLGVETIYEEYDGSIIALKPEFNFYRLYFATINLKSMKKIFYSLPKDRDIFCEILTKNTIEEPLQKVLQNIFQLETIYQKAFKKISLTGQKTLINNVVDCDLIYKKIYDTFNVYYDHLMDIDELKFLAKNNNIVTIYDKNILTSFIVFKIQGKKVYLNHIANYGSKQNLLDLWNKFYLMLNNLEISYIDLWYNTQYGKAVNMYNMEGFNSLPLKNYIYKFIH